MDDVSPFFGAMLRVVHVNCLELLCFFSLHWEAGPSGRLFFYDVVVLLMLPFMQRAFRIGVGLGGVGPPSKTSLLFPRSFPFFQLGPWSFEWVEGVLPFYHSDFLLGV